jgi:hypothetical protein
MTASLPDSSSLDTLKRALADGFPRVRSSHLSEALAFGLGFRTNAALKTELNRPTLERAPMSLDIGRLRERLQAFGYRESDDAFNLAATLVEQQYPGLLGVDSESDRLAEMTLGFDPLNLKAAVDAVMKSAAEKEQDITMSMHDLQRVDLRNREQVQTHLMKEARLHYEKVKKQPEGIRIAHIEKVVYSPVGFVFENNYGEMHPPPTGAPIDGPIAHLAYFWSVL